MSHQWANFDRALSDVWIRYVFSSVRLDTEPLRQHEPVCARNVQELAALLLQTSRERR
jgi:hypothetical protein